MGAGIRPLVGRRTELEALEAVVGACSDGGSAVVEITGDPGIGKTRLLAELGAAARAHGLAVLSGRASQFERESSLGIFAEPLSQCGGGLADRGGEPFERHRLHEAVGRMLTEAGAERGVLLCLDDLHWADEDSLELLHYLLRRPPATALIVACAYRPRQASARLLALLGQAVGGYRALRLPLGPLDREACRTLLGDRDGDLDADAPRTHEQLYALSGGNPLYLEVLCELAAISPADPAEYAAELPGTLRAALAREIALLTPDELGVLRAAAVLGDPFDPLHLGPTADLDGAVTLAALDTLAGLDLLRPAGRVGGRGRLQFRHPLVREVVCQDTPPGWWLAAHARADAALRGSGAGPVERAPLLARSARPGDREAIKVLIEAAALTKRHAPTTAAGWLRTALHLSANDRTGEGAGQRFEIHLGLADCHGTTGDLPSCRDALARALDLVSADRPEQRIAVVAYWAAIERILGSAGAARTVLVDELARWRADDATANPLRLQLATLGMARGDFATASAQLDALLACAEAPIDRATRTAVSACRALGAAYSGRTDELRTHASEAAASLDVLDDTELTTLLDEVGQLGWAEVLAERHRDAIRHVERGVGIARRTGQSHLMPYLLLCLSYAQQETGLLEQGIASAAGAEEIAHQLGRPDLIGYAQALRATASALREGPAAAARSAEQALRTIEHRGRLAELATAALASIRLDQRRPQDCVELVRGITGPGSATTTHALRAGWFATAAQAEMSRGDTSRAAQWADRAAEAAAAVGLPGQSGHAALARGCVLRDEPEQASKLFAEAVSAFADVGLVFAEIRARLLLGRALCAADRLDEAGEVVGTAKTLADRHGAGYLSALAVNAQRQIGARRPRGAQPRMLSEQEIRISLMVAQGLTNRDIAANLFVSTKTVEAHLTRIFRKLDVRSRAAVAGALERLQPSAP
jgi:DNA-binding CsgD family transcriptional regulator